MKTLFFFGLFLSFNLLATAQTDPVKWSFESEKVGTNEYEIIATAQIQRGWSLYSQEIKSDDGPIPTQILINKDENLQILGKVEENGAKTKEYDPTFQMELVKLSGRMVFKQRVKVAGGLDEVSGQITFMTCNSNSCMPPKDIDFSVPLDE